MTGRQRVPVSTGVSAGSWSGAYFAWEDQETWTPRLSDWLAPMLREDAITRMRQADISEFYIDDPEWIRRLGRQLKSDIDYLIEDLASELAEFTLRVYHASRLEDAGEVHRQGLRVNDPEHLSQLVRRIVNEERALAWMKPKLEQIISDFEHRERDTGRLYLGADSRELSGHYLLYGSEWITVFLGLAGRDVLLDRGVPTAFEIDLSLGAVHSELRTHFARTMLREWSRQISVPNGVSPRLDFTFTLWRSIPSESIVGHWHPESIKDPLCGNIIRRNRYLDCAQCCPRPAQIEVRELCSAPHGARE